MAMATPGGRKMRVKTTIHTWMPSVLAVCLLAAPCAAQEWADKMFETRSHDFGTIARGAKAEFAFEFTNHYLGDVHVADVQAGCGCTTVRVGKETVKTYEKGVIIAHINSDRFLGKQGAMITVTIDKPFYAQVQLQVKVYVYSDVMLEPSSVALGNVARGNPAEGTISVRYTGQSDWQILEVRSDNPHVTGTVTETSRQGNRITYDLKAVLAKDATAGFLNERLWLITNDPQTKHVPVLVEGQVQADISVSPESLFLGEVQPGQSITKMIMVRGQKPFRIVSIQANCECLQATAPKDEGSKSLYVVPITFTPGEKTGKVTQIIRIETDSGKAVAEVTVYGVVGG